MRVAIIDADTMIYSVCGLLEEEDDFSRHKSTLDLWYQDIFRETQATHFVAVITKGKLKRHDMATVKEYKGNRKDKTRPKFFYDLRNYMEEKYVTVHRPGFEADDVVLGIAKHLTSQSTECVIVTNDKDLYQVTGTFFNPKDQSWTIVTEKDATENLHMQWLHGDSTDNIPGIEKVGPKKAAKILSAYEQAQYPEAVFRAYITKYGLIEGAKRCAETLSLIMMETDYEKLFNDAKMGVDWFPDLIDVGEYVTEEDESETDDSSTDPITNF